MVRSQPPAGRSVALDAVVALRETRDAVLCAIRGHEVWIPQSQITDESEVWRAGHKGRLVVTRWLAEQKGFVPRRLRPWRAR